ncbi:MAG: hypothetical protein AAFY39_10900 [Pseudomonadota bacterium]
MGRTLTGGMTLAAALLGLCATAPASALNFDELATTNAAISTELDRTIVLRSVRMPGAFGRLILDLDRAHGMINRTSDVTRLTDADVWVVGLKGWSDTAWLEESPLHSLFAGDLHSASPDLQFKSFQWNVRGGQMLDVHFVNLEQTSDLSHACLAEMVYRLSHRAVAHRRAGDMSLVSARAEPLVSLSRTTPDLNNCQGA